MVDWETFWKLIGTLDGGTEMEPIGRLTHFLSSRPLSEITGFGELLAESLYRLDLECFGANMSGDQFLYVRAAVVAAGRAAYQSVFEDPANFAAFADRWGEPLLYVAQRAYERQTGEEWDRDTRYSFESYSNHEGWRR